MGQVEHADAGMRRALRIAIVGGLLCGLTCGVVATGIACLPAGVDASLVIASCTVGMMVATPLFGFLADTIGRKRTIQLGVFLLLVASLVIFSCRQGGNPVLFGRFCQGAGIGCLFAVIPTYLSELASNDEKGRAIALFQFFLLLGQVGGAAIGLMLTQFYGGRDWLWQFAFGFPAIPALLFLIASGWLQESPAGVRAQKRDVGFSLISELWAAGCRKPFVLAILTCVLVAATANGPIMNFSVRAMHNAGLAGVRANVVDILMQGLCLVATLVASRLVDRIGSRRLMVIGALGAAAGLVGLAMAVPMQSGICGAISLLAYSSLFCFGPGVCVFVVIAELLPERVRAVGIAVALFANHATSAGAAFVFAKSVESIGYGCAYAAFAAALVTLAAFSVFFLSRAH